MVCDLRDKFMKGIMASCLLSLALGSSCHVIGSHLKRPMGPGSESPTKSHVNVDVNLQPQSNLQMTAAPAESLTPASWGILSQNHPANPFQLVGWSLGMICFTVIDNQDTKWYFEPKTQKVLGFLLPFWETRNAGPGVNSVLSLSSCRTLVGDFTALCLLPSLSHGEPANSYPPRAAVGRNTGWLRKAHGQYFLTRVSLGPWRWVAASLRADQEAVKAEPVSSGWEVSGMMVAGGARDGDRSLHDHL